MRLRYEPFNKLIGCAGHHVYYTHNPERFIRTVEKWFPERLAKIELHRNELGKVDVAAWIERFSA